jgi:hypothetical protein
MLHGLVDSNAIRFYGKVIVSFANKEAKSSPVGNRWLPRGLERKSKGSDEYPGELLWEEFMTPMGLSRYR